MITPSPLSLIDHFAALDDPRQSGKVLYPLPEILLVVPCGILARAEDSVEMRRWSWSTISLCSAFCPMQAACRAMPLNDVINAIDGDLFSKCFSDWGTARTRRWPTPMGPDVVAITGKTSRRTRDRGKDRGPLHMVEFADATLTQDL